MIRLAPIAALAATVATAVAVGGCGTTHDPALCLGDTCVAVATSIFNADFTGMGTLDSVDLASRAPHLGLDATLDPDTTLKIVGEELFVLQRDTGALRIYDPKTFQVKLELPLGDATHPAGKSFPQDFWVDADGKIWVTLSGNDAAHALAIVDRNMLGSIIYLGLPQDPSDTDGKPEPAKLYACNDKLYVALQSYWFDMNGKVNYAPGRIAILDPSTRSTRGTITLAGRNPNDITALGSDCNDVVVACSAGLTTAPDGQGNIERIDLDASASKGVLATDEQLGGRPSLLAAAAANLLYVALYFDPQPNGMGDVFLSSVKVVAFDPQMKIVKNDVTGKFGNVNFLRTHSDDLFIGAGVFAGMEDPSKSPRGLYIAPADGKMITAPPIDLQLTPSAIALP
jgi:hypothetical protein